MRPLLPILVTLLIPLSLFANTVPAGRQLVLMPTGQWIGSSVRTIPHHSAAFDGERFLVATLDDGLRVALIDEGAAEPRAIVKLANETTSLPIVAWDGTRYLVFWSDRTMRVSAVSAQGVLERTFTLDGVRTIGGVSAGPNGTAILVYGDVDSHWVLDVWFLDAEMEVTRTTRIGRIAKSSGFGSTYHGPARIVPFGSGHYVAWVAARSGRIASMVGTRISAEGEALDLAPYPHEGDSAEGRILISHYALTLDHFEVHPFGDSVVVLMRWGGGPTTAFVRADGSFTVMPLYILGYSGSTRLADGTIALLIQPLWNEPSHILPFLRSPQPLPRRRTSRH